MDLIPKKDYKMILENMPVCCVDLVFHLGNKVLLVLRKQEPVKGEFWLPGGRIFKNERLVDAVARKAKEEFGVDVIIERKIGVYEIMFNNGPFKDLKTGVHDIAVCFLVKPLNKDFKIKIDETSSDYKWVAHIERSMHPYLKEVLADSKVFSI